MGVNFFNMKRMLIQIVFQLADYCNSLQNSIHLLQTRFLEFNDLKVETGSEPLLIKLDPSRQTVQLNLKIHVYSY